MRRMRAPGGGGKGEREEEKEREKEGAEALRFGDSVTLFAEKMFGFLQGASGAAEEDEESSVFVRSLEHRHRPTGWNRFGSAESILGSAYVCVLVCHARADQRAGCPGQL